MDRIKQQIRYNCSARTGVIKYIVIHDTGNTGAGANAKSHFQYFNGGNRGSSADIFVDDTSAWYVNDYTKYYSWHCGDGRGKYGITNQNSVGVEMCVNADGDYEAAMRNTAEVVRELMAELNIPFERVVRHYDASRKKCPASMSYNNWERWRTFLAMLQESEELTMSQYDELKQMIQNIGARVDNLANPMIYNYIDDNMPEWARPTVTKLVTRGHLKGDENGKLNLSMDMLRMLVINDRAGMYDKE